MRAKARRGGGLAAALLALHLCGAVQAQDEDDSHARWRAEAWGGDTFDGRGNWLHDGYFATALEHEWRQLWHIYMGLRALPTLAYFDVEPIVGTAVGMTHRLYTSRDGSGLFFGPAVAVVVHYGRFAGNSAYVNFLSSAEIGYQFSGSPLRFSARLEHLSNANTADENRGWNGISLLIGWELPIARRPATATPAL